MLPGGDMKSLRNILLLFAAVAVVLAGPSRLTADQPSQFESVFQLVRTNLVGIDAERFDRDALRSLLRRMDGQVELLKPGRAVTLETDLVEPVRRFDQRYGYLRVRHVEAGLAESILEEVRDFDPSGESRGLMLDLRFATGENYDEAVKAVNNFIGRDETQLVVGKRQLRTTLNTNLIAGPVAILVNAETVGAAEALAGLLRRNDVGLLIGSRTAGKVKVFSQFSLADGSQLRVATDEVRLGDGRAVSQDGLAPDIEVRLDPDAERRFFGDAYALPKGRQKRQHGLVNEAELVRQLKQRLNPDSVLPEAAGKKESGREVFDPVLGRALDLLKGLNLLGPVK